MPKDLKLLMEIGRRHPSQQLHRKQFGASTKFRCLPSLASWIQRYTVKAWRQCRSCSASAEQQPANCFRSHFRVSVESTFENQDKKGQHAVGSIKTMEAFCHILKRRWQHLYQLMADMARSDEALVDCQCGGGLKQLAFASNFWHPNFRIALVPKARKTTSSSRQPKLAGNLVFPSNHLESTLTDSSAPDNTPGNSCKSRNAGQTV